MKFLPKFILIFIAVFVTGCSQESCKIDFDSSKSEFEDAISTIMELDLKMDSNQIYFRPIKIIRKKDKIISASIFEQIEFIECHQDSTVIFQAPNCDEETGFRDVIYILAYSPKGIEHLERKRNLVDIKEVAPDWFLGQHINTIAD